MSKTRKAKQEEYNNKYGHIPVNLEDRLSWMYDYYKMTPKKEEQVIQKRNEMISALQYYDINLTLYQSPEATPRPRFRVINRTNFTQAARDNSQFVHVYNLYAKDDHTYMQRMLEDGLVYLDSLISTPIIVEYVTFLQTPKYYNTEETFLAEIGLIRPMTKPDWDNLGKKYSDISNHNIWLDDQFVIRGTVDRFYSILPRIEIRIRYLNMVYNKHQFKSIVNRRDYNENINLNYFGG